MVQYKFYIGPVALPNPVGGNQTIQIIYPIGVMGDLPNGVKVKKIKFKINGTTWTGGTPPDSASVTTNIAFFGDPTISWEPALGMQTITFNEDDCKDLDSQFFQPVDIKITLTLTGGSFATWDTTFPALEMQVHTKTDKKIKGVRTIQGVQSITM